MKYPTRLLTGMALILCLAPMTTSAEPITGCNAPASLSSGTHDWEFPAGSGITRTFRVHVPRGYRTGVPAPLVTIFHGWGGNENAFLGRKSVTSLADKRGYILVAPRGLGSGDPDYSYNSWSFSGSTTGLDGYGGKICGGDTPNYRYQSCLDEYGENGSNTCSWTQCQADDIDFTVALVDHIKKNLCVDTDKVFATGGSNGGMFTWELGQDSRSAPTFRAIAPLIGLPHRGYLNPQGKLDGKHKFADLPVLVITGTRDNVVPPGDWDDSSFTTTSNGDDEYYYTGATAITKSWAYAHDCNISSDAIAFNDGYRKTDCRTYCSGDPGWPRVLDCRARMGHSYSLSWSWKLIMRFFDEHSD